MLRLQLVKSHRENNYKEISRGDETCAGEKTYLHQVKRKYAGARVQASELTAWF